MKDRDVLRGKVRLAVTKVFDEALASMEMLVAAFKSSIDASDVERYREKIKHVDDAFMLARRKLLRVGNDQIRQLSTELGTWTVRKNRVYNDYIQFYENDTHNA